MKIYRKEESSAFAHPNQEAWLVGVVFILALSIKL